MLYYISYKLHKSRMGVEPTASRFGPWRSSNRATETTYYLFNDFKNLRKKWGKQELNLH